VTPYDLRMPCLAGQLCVKSWLDEQPLDLDLRSPSPLSLCQDWGAVVTDRSPRRLRTAVECLARYFKREFHYDFIQYSATDSDPTARAFVWTTEWDYRHDDSWDVVIGACCFRWRAEDRPAHWALQWVWFHPFARRRGNLSKAWPYFRQRFGAFDIEEPVSEAMRAFVADQQAALMAQQQGAPV
jgi:hypothetical protein